MLRKVILSLAVLTLTGVATLSANANLTFGLPNFTIPRGGGDLNGGGLFTLTNDSKTDTVTITDVGDLDQPGFFTPDNGVTIYDVGGGSARFPFDNIKLSPNVADPFVFQTAIQDPNSYFVKDDFVGETITEGIMNNHIVLKPGASVTFDHTDSTSGEDDSPFMLHLAPHDDNVTGSVATSGCVKRFL